MACKVARRSLCGIAQSVVLPKKYVRPPKATADRKKGGTALANYKWHKRAAAAVLACLMTAAALPATAAFAAKTDTVQTTAASAEKAVSDTGGDLTYEEQETYSDYYDQYAEQPRPTAEITVSGADFQKADCESYEAGGYTDKNGESRNNALIWNNAEGSFSYQLNVPETGIYSVQMTYCPIVSNTSEISVSLAIDGEVPYDTASRLKLNKVYQNKTEIKTDDVGNQVRPAQEQIELWQTTWLGDSDGLFNEPVFFYLEKGTHEITLSSEKAYFALETIRFAQPEEVSDYDTYVSSVNASVSKDSTPSGVVRIEGENAVLKSDSVLYPTYDNSSSSISPSDPKHMLYNTIGSGNWEKALQTITWQVDAGTLAGDGWYKLGIKARQEEMRGFYSNRRIYIDGKVPSEEFDQVKFYYDTDFRMTTVQNDDGEDVYVYLTAGEDHTITMEVIPGEIGDSMRQLDAIVLDLNTYYRKIVMITGPEPDKYTDYYVHEKIPELVDEFQRISDELKAIQGHIESLANSKGSEAASLEQMTVILDKCISEPLQIPNYLSQIKDYITSLSSWMRDYRDQPLEVDYLELASPDADFPSAKAGFWSALSYSFQRFAASWDEDYSSLSSTTGDDAIEVWVSLGRDQAQVVKDLVESEFQQQYNVPISINLVVGGVVEATLADKGPDVALFLGGEFPVNLAARGLLADVSRMDGYDEMTRLYQDTAMVPYQYEGGTYGLPLTRSWAMMFYRKDVLSELGFTQAPQTWEELIDMLPALQRSYMSAGLVLPAVAADANQATISAATESGLTFASLLLQRGQNYYNSAQTKTTFDTNAAIDAFEMWTDFYTKYDFDQQYDAFSRFRTGEYPIVVSDYCTFFNQLAVAAPEIDGLWGFAPIPGTLQEDGTISHAVNSNNTGAVIFNKVDKKTNGMDNAWTFLKWFCSTEVQVEYGTQIEGLLGQMGRYATANTEALTQLAWSTDEANTILGAMDELEEIPIIPASYSVTRNVMNAFRDVVNNNENPRDTLMSYNRDINEEITRKRENLGLDS